MKRRILQADRVGRKVLYDRLILLALVILFIVVGRGVWLLWVKNNLAESRMSASESRLKQLEERKQVLDSKLAKLGTSRGLEEEIRTNFSVIKPGEKVINIVDPDKATTTSITTPAKRSWWQLF